jgi:hypothetical protein
MDRSNLKLKHFCYLLLTFWIGLNSPVFGMTFEVVLLKGEPAIIAQGIIVAGDAGRLKRVLKKENRHSLGYFAMALNSPGGNVAAAFEISKLMDASNVNTYVPPEFKCASACAMIVFIAGREHINTKGGSLGFHGCYNSITKQIVGLCNEAIAQHSIDHGTAYGSVMAFIERVPYDQMIWISGDEADCWAINRYKTNATPNNYEKCVFDAIRNAVKKQ